jgi:hypothetical protein
MASTALSSIPATSAELTSVVAMPRLSRSTPTAPEVRMDRNGGGVCGGESSATVATPTRSGDSNNSGDGSGDGSNASDRCGSRSGNNSSGGDSSSLALLSRSFPAPTHTAVAACTMAACSSGVSSGIIIAVADAEAEPAPPSAAADAHAVLLSAKVAPNAEAATASPLARVKAI